MDNSEHGSVQAIETRVVKVSALVELGAMVFHIFCLFLLTEKGLQKEYRSTSLISVMKTLRTPAKTAFRSFLALALRISAEKKPHASRLLYDEKVNVFNQVSIVTTQISTSLKPEFYRQLLCLRKHIFCFILYVIFGRSIDGTSLNNAKLWLGGACGWRCILCSSRFFLAKASH